MSGKFKKQWWATLFDERYLTTYVDIVTPELTTQQISFLLKRLQLRKGAEILDLACGHGRHAIELARRGYQVTGLDFSKRFIELARKDAQAQGVRVAFIRDDMRNLSFVNKFDAIINMFTSFGYFDDESDNALVLRNVSRALKPKGKFLIDLNNAVRALALMVQDGKPGKRRGLLVHSRKDKLSNGLIVATKHTLNPETMCWRMVRRWKENGKSKSYRTNVRLYSLPELEHLMEENSLRVEKVWGDFQGARFGPNARRMIVLARRA